MNFLGFNLFFIVFWRFLFFLQQEANVLFFTNILPTQTVTAAVHNNTLASVRLTNPEHGPYGV